MTTTKDPKAPHGRDENGVPLAPYGHNLDGTPRKSNRGARAGQRGNKNTAAVGPTAKVSSMTDVQRKGMLCDLADMIFVTPLASASILPAIAKRIGPRQTDALAGDAFILANYFPGIADGLILWSKTKPGMLAWLDKIETAAPSIVFANAVLAAGKAIAQNHLSPNQEVAKAGRALAAMRIQQMAQAVNQQAAAMNIVPDSQPAEDHTREMTVEDFERAAYNRTTEFAAA